MLAKYLNNGIYTDQDREQILSIVEGNPSVFNEVCSLLQIVRVRLEILNQQLQEKSALLQQSEKSLKESVIFV